MATSKVSAVSEKAKGSKAKAIGYHREGADASPVEGCPTMSEQLGAFQRFCELGGHEIGATFIEQEGDNSDSSIYARLRNWLRNSEKGSAVVVVSNLRCLASTKKQAIERVVDLSELGAEVVCLQKHKPDALADAVNEWLETQRGASRGKQVSSAMKARAVRGQGLGKPAYGYRIGPKRKFEVVPDEAAVVQQVYKMYLEQNAGIRRIARHLNEQNIPTRTGGKWSMVAVRDVLRNRTYIGTYIRFGMRVPDNHPPIISPSVFRQAQERMNSKGHSRAYVPPSAFLLSGLVFCGRCDNRMIGVTRHQAWTKKTDGTKRAATYRYYQCQSRTNQSV